MTSAFGLCAAATALLALPGTAMAAGITYDCDTAANHFSELSLPTSGVRFTVSGHVQMNAMAASKTYVPLARLQIAAAVAPGESPKEYVGFTLSALAADPKKTPSGAAAVPMLAYSVSGKDDDLLSFSMLEKPFILQTFSLSYDGSTVVVNLGKESKSFPLKVAEPVVRIVCSTGEFLFTDLAIKAGG
ncbi:MULTISPECIES: hypothetical protein [Sphingomonas]|jgi:hypothetical protein|uniref:hypothetical protein n=1 Tax=Sphingomonas TaxID=13687 RepID=UPI001AEA355C|nr:hypothetical protein [Alphaproteobacteria bacterium]